MARARTRNSRLQQLSLLSLLSLALFSSQISAQLPDAPDLNTITNNPVGATAAQPPAGPTAQPVPQSQPQQSQQSQQTKPTNAAAKPNKQSAKQDTPPKPTSSNAQPSDSSSSSSDAFIATDTNEPTSPVSSYGITGAPTIAGVGIPSLVIPDLSNAPFMQKSSLPEGTVFIAVGAALGFLGMCVLAWRGLVAWSLQRSVRRAATQQYASEKKTHNQRYHGYPSLYNSENVSLEHLAAANTTQNGGGAARKEAHSRTTSSHKASNRNSYHQNASRTSRNASSLFFSPTAGAGAGVHSQTNRGSSYLPPGFYSSGATGTPPGASTTSLGGPTLQGYSRVDSQPGTPPSTAGEGRQSERNRDTGRGYDSSRYSQDRRSGQHHRGQSGGSLGVGALPQGRAPSAYLEDLFENHGNGPRERF